MTEGTSEVSLPDLLSNLSTSTAATLLDSTGNIILSGITSLTSKAPFGGPKIDPGSKIDVVFPTRNDSVDFTIDQISELSDKLGAELWWFLFAVLFAFMWFMFVLFYNARMVGFILSFIFRVFLFRWKRSLTVESISISVIGGKIMFRNVMFVTPDYTIKVHDGFILFLWWARVDPSAEETPIHNLYKKPWQAVVKYRILVKLLGFEYHRYNRLWRYAQVEETFGLKRLVAQHRGDPLEDAKVREAAVAAARAHASSNVSIFNGWRELIPAVKFEIRRGTVSFGNKLVPYSFVLKIEHFTGVYFTGKASNPADLFMHIYQATGDGVVCKFVKNPNYTGPDFHPPPKSVTTKKTKESGDDLATSYSLIRTNRVVFDYYYDEPGVVSARLIDRDPVLENSFPVHGIRVHLGGTPKGKKPQPVVVQYGPWADTQRSLLWRFFYPVDYKPLEPFLGQMFGELRTYRSFDMRFMLDSKGRLELQNQMNDELTTLTMTMDGAYVDDEDPNPSTTWLSTSIPMINHDSGYKIKVNMSFQRPDATTSLKFRPFVKAEQLDCEVTVSYPLIWNEHQHWKVAITSSKLTAHALYEHKNFLRDFFFAWGSQDPPDLLAFIPYTVQIDAQVKDFEAVILVNSYNWVDTSASARENTMLALCGSSILFTCTLPYDQFLPESVQFRNYFTGNDLYMRVFLPTTNSTSYVLTSLSKHLRVIGRDGQPITDPFASSRAATPSWRGVTIGWVDIASAPMGSVSIVFTYHPVPLLRSQNVDKTGTLRGTLKQPSEVLVRLTDEDTPKPIGPFSSTDKSSEPRFDPSVLPPDIIALSVNIGDGGTIVAYGSIVKMFLNFKENYFGFNQKTAPMELSISSNFEHQLPPSHQLAPPPGAKSAAAFNPPVFGAFTKPQKRFDGREYRPLSVQVTITASDLIGYLPKHVGIHDPPCVQLRCEHLKLEMDKCYQETKLQLVLTPLFATLKDIVPRADATRTGRSISEGFLCLSVLQVRGHALFSGEGVSLDQDTAEYGWLMDFVIGDFIGKTSLPHIMNIVTSLETFLFLFSEDETHYKKPPTFIERCWHGRNSKQCPDGMPECEVEDDMKYRMVRLSVESIDLSILETNPDEANLQKGVGLLQLSIRPSVRLVFCSSHIGGQPGIQMYVPEINVRQLMTSDLLRPTSDSPAGGENNVEVQKDSDKLQPWVEAASISLGPVCVAARLPSVHSANQLIYWRTHDAKSKRLYFMYNAGNSLPKCGCFGACSYFGASADDVNFVTPPWPTSRVSRDPRTRAGCFGFGDSILLRDQLILESLMETLGNTRLASQAPLQSTPSVFGDAKPGMEPPPVPIRRFPPPQQRSSIARVSQELAQDVRQAHSMSESERYYSASEGDEDDRRSSSQDSDATLGDHRSRPKAPSFPPPPAPPPRAPPPFFASSPSSSTISSDDSDEELGGYTGAPMTLPGEQVLVNMLRQMDMDLTESPLLFHHYAAHLSQYTVHNVFGSQAGVKGVTKLIVAFLAAQKEWDFVPMIHPHKRGFACEMMRMRKGDNVKANKSPDWQKILSQLFDPTTTSAFHQQHSSSKAILEVNRCLDIFVTPLVLETGRWFFSSLESVVRAVHPSSVLDAIHIHAHKSLLEKYEAANLTSDSMRRPLSEPTPKLQIVEPSPSAATSRWRPKTPPKWEVSVSLPELKICSLERAVVEEHVSAFNMDPEVLKLLSCASLFAMSWENFKFEIALSPHRSNAVSASDGFTVIDAQGERDNFARIYTCDQLSEHLAGAYLSGSLSVSQVGAQLWRLKRQSGFTSDVQVTEIPTNMSRVLYTFVDNSDDSGVTEFRRPSLSLTQTTQPLPSSPFGFIMAEMGMENVRLDLLKKPALEDGEPVEDGVGEEKLILTPLVDRNLTYARQHVQFNVDNQQQQGGVEGASKDANQSISAHGAGLAASAAHTKDHIDYVHKATSSSEIHQRQPTFYDASCLLKFLNFWLSFPSPPAPVGGTGLSGMVPSKSILPPVEKTVDYTMFDWNMLSTASAAVSAWLSVGFRLGAVAKKVSSEKSRRLSAIVAALLTEAYDKHDSYRIRSKYPNCFTQASQLLQEDPTCQLATMLRRYLEVTDVSKLEDDITDANLPSNITVRKGILILIRRDWRNILHSAVLKKPAADFKKGRRFWRLQRLQEGSDGANDAGNLNEPELAGGNFGDIPMQQLGGPTRRKPTHTRVKSIPVHMPGVGSVSVRDDTPTGAGMVSSQLPKPIIEHQQSRTNLAQQSSTGDNRIAEWVHQACQIFGQQMLNRSQSIGQLFMGGGGVLGPGGVEQDDFADEETMGLMNAGGQTGAGAGDEEQIGEVADLGRFALMAVDAEPQWLFRPLMSFLDLPLDERPQAAAFLHNFGRTVAIQIRVDRFEISIVDPAEALLNARSRQKMPTFCSDPSFVCDGFSLTTVVSGLVEAKNPNHQSSFRSGENAGGEASGGAAPNSSENAGRPASDYGLKGASHLLEIIDQSKIANQLCLTLNCNVITQCVHMPLLRLINQCIGIAANISDARARLRQLTAASTSANNRNGTRNGRGHRKQDSAASSTQTSGANSTGAPVGGAVTPVGSDKSAGLSDKSKRSSRRSTIGKVFSIVQTRAKNLSSTPADESFNKSGGLARSDSARRTPDRLIGRPGDTDHGAEDTSSPAVERRTVYDVINERTPQVWTKLFRILEIYNRIPETKFVDKLPPIRDSAIAVEEGTAGMTPASLDNPDSHASHSRGGGGMVAIPMVELKREDSSRAAPVVSALKQNIVVRERVKLVMIGHASVKKVLILARISGLKLETVISGVEGSVCHKTRIRELSRRSVEESVATVRFSEAEIILQEGGVPSANLQGPPQDITVVRCSVGQCQAMLDALPPTRTRAQRLDCVLLSVGRIQVNIPQHALQLHTVMTRETEQITKVVQELKRSTRIRSGAYEESFDGLAASGGMATGGRQPPNTASPRFRPGSHMYSAGTPISPRPPATLPVDDSDIAPQRPPRRRPVRLANAGPANQALVTTTTTAAVAAATDAAPASASSKANAAVKYLMAAEGLAVEAALLPSLSAQYAIGQVSSRGIISRQSQFLINVDKHSLVFESRLGGKTFQLSSLLPNLGTALPDRYSFDLPSINVLANQKPLTYSGIVSDGMDNFANIPQQLVVTAEMGPIVNRLDSTILNQLIFIQRAFLSEISDVVMKIASGSPKNQPWNVIRASSIIDPTGMNFEDEDQRQQAPPVVFKYNIKFRIQAIELTATSPTNSAVQIKTGLIKLTLSSKDDALSGGSRQDQSHPLRLFTEASGNVEISLGQLLSGNYITNNLEFNQLSFFKTRIQVTSASEASSDLPTRDGLKITLSQPQILVRPTAIDKGLMLWLNYKKAYDFWVEQRKSGQFQLATRRLQSAISQIATPVQPAAVLPFIEFKVENLGIALPLFTNPKTNLAQIYGDASTLSDPVESGHAMVISLDRSQISAFTSQALVSRGTFEQFCLRFADDFSPYREGSWTPQQVKVPLATGHFIKFVQDSCSVPEGSFSICSKTVSPLSESENAKLLVSVQWQTQGIYIRAGVGIGEKLSLLGNTLTLMSGEEVGGSSTPDNEKVAVSTEKKEITDQEDIHDQLAAENLQELLPPNVVAALTDSSIDANRRSGILSAELERLSNLIGDLRHAKAEPARITAEERKLRALEELYTTEFKRSFYSRVQGSGQQLLKDNLSRLAGVEPVQPATPATLSSKAASKKFHRRTKSSGGALLPVKPAHFVLPKSSLETHPEYGSQGNVNSSAENSDVDDADTVSANRNNQKIGIGLQRKLIRKPFDAPDQSSPSSSFYRQRAISQPPTITPVVDKEFNINLKISSGECSLYPNKEPEDQMTKSGMSDGRSPRIDLSRRLIADPQMGSLIDVEHATTFYIPAVSTRVRYATMGTQAVVEVPGRVAAAKRGTLHAWLDIQTFPTETVLTPWLVRFFEQAIDPISDRAMTHTSSFYGVIDKPGQDVAIPAGGASGVDADSSSRGGVPSSADSASSTNNDNNEANTGPTSSGVSGSTGAASSGIGVGSVPVDVAVYVSVKPSVIKFSSFPTSRLECRLQLPSLDLLFSTQSKGGENAVGLSPRGSSAQMPNVEEISGGFCITTSLSNFTFVVYHPLPVGEDQLSIPRQSRSSSSRGGVEQPDVIRGKNPVSVQLGTIRINFARYWAKKVAVNHATDSPTTDELNIKLSIVCDIGSAFFRLDVRRLNEIMSILKAWSSRPLARRVIFGSGAASQVTTTVQGRLGAPVQSFDEASARSFGPLIQSHHIILSAVRLSKLEVELRMDQIMYKTEWNNDDFRVYGGVAVDSNGSRFVKVHTRLARSALTTSGLVAGEASVSGLNAYVMISKSQSRPPVHRLFINMHEVETKVEYRGTLILIGRISSLVVHFFTQWFVDTVMKGRRKTGTSVSLNGEIGTEHLHIIISSATEGDLVRLGLSVKESIDKQLTDSMQLWTNAFGDLGNRQPGQKIVSEIRAAVATQPSAGLRLHRHWQPILDRMVKAKAEWLPPRELDSIMFNAMMTLSTKNAVLACFHGSTFHASQWALFALRGASSTFNTSPQMIDVQPPGIHILQMLEFSLAQTLERRNADWNAGAGTNIAGTVMRIVEPKSAMLTRQLRSTSDWFHYAFSCSEAKDLDDFPVASIGGQRPPRSDYTHETEVIFKLPAASLHLRSEQNQSLAVIPTITEWNESKFGPRPMVACSVQTDFYDHLFVSFNAESFIFLHDLIRSYLSVSTTGGQTTTTSAEEGSPKPRTPGAPSNPTEALQLDVRQFLTTQWLLNPTVRLLTFGREIDTGGIERVLVRLGFNQARSTIPKWIQRGVNDSLDALSAAILEKLVEAAFSLE